jgi:hypothetical protein
MRYLAIAGACLLAGCQVGADGLATAGVSAATAQKIATDTAQAGQLFCTDGVMVMAVAGVTVTSATAATVARACAEAQVVGALTPPATTPVPIAAPAGVQALLAAVPAATAAAVQASKTSS